MITTYYSVEQIRTILRWPHLIGRMVGKTKLTSQHSLWLRDLFLAPGHQGNQAHRGAYKTTILTETGLVFWLLTHPDDRIALMRETWTEANNTLRTIAQYMENECVAELFRALHGRYPKATTQRDGRLTYDFKGSVTKEGSIDAYGVDTVPVGSHYDMIHADDVVTIRDRYSRAKRERTVQNLQEVITNILDPGKLFHIVGTPWHKQDAWAMLAEMGIIPKKYDCYSTGILSSEEIEEKKRTSTPVMFAANYLLEHIASDDAMFRDPEFGPWDKRIIRRVRGHVDARFKGKHFTAMTILAQRSDGKFFVYGRIYDNDVKSVELEIREKMFDRDVAIMHIETNPDKGYTGELFMRPRDGRALHVEMYHESMNKQNKIQTYITEFWDRLVFAEDCDEDYIAQIMEYREDQGKNQPDDAPDSLASILREMVYPTDTQTAPGAQSLYGR